MHYKEFCFIRLHKQKQKIEYIKKKTLINSFMILQPESSKEKLVVNAFKKGKKIVIGSTVARF